jgi:ankyrin repeat protein
VQAIPAEPAGGTNAAPRPLTAGTGESQLNVGNYYIRLQPSLLGSENRKQLVQRFRHVFSNSAPVEKFTLERSAWHCARIFKCGSHDKAAEKLNRAAEEGNASKVQHYSTIVPDPVAVSDSKAKLLVNQAAAGLAADVERLLEDLCADPNQTHPLTGETALTAAAAKGHGEVIEALLADGRTNPNMPSSTTGKTPLCTAAENGQSAALASLLAHRKHGFVVWPDVPDDNGHTPLTLAAKRVHPEVIKLLAQHPLVEVNRVVNGEPPLVSVAKAAASVDDRAKAIEYLRLAGADLNLGDADGNTALDIAIANNDTAAVRALCAPIDELHDKHDQDGWRVQLGTAVNLQRTKPNGRTPVEEAVLMGHADVIEALLDLDLKMLGAQPLGEDPQSERMAALRKQRMAEHGESLLAIGHTQLTLAAKRAHPEVIKVLAKHPLVDVNRVVNGEPPLVSVAKAAASVDDPLRCAKAIEYLRLAGADLNLGDADGNTALDIAIANNDAAAVRALCAPIDELHDKHGQDGWLVQVGTAVNLQRTNANGRTPVEEAVLMGHADVIEALLDLDLKMLGAQPLGEDPQSERMAALRKQRMAAHVESFLAKGGFPKAWVQWLRNTTQEEINQNYKESGWDPDKNHVDVYARELIDQRDLHDKAKKPVIVAQRDDSA